jgi:hypothetical protein
MVSQERSRTIRMEELYDGGVLKEWGFTAWLGKGCFGVRADC